MVELSLSLAPGTTLQGGKYRIEKFLGQGGFGITYLAEQVALKRKVALKEFFMKDCCERDSDSSQVTVGTAGTQRELVEKFRGKFIREAQMIADMSHQHIVRIYDVFEENGTAYYVMEYHPGGSLKDLVEKEGPLTEGAALKYFREVADALGYIHSQKTVHLDVKPSNILLDKNGSAVLIDFGISKHYDEEGEQTSSTPPGTSKGYAPLEQSKTGEVSQFTPATDIYALGATLLYLLTGKNPPDAADVNEDGLVRPSGISDGFWSVIEKCMQPRRKDRPQDISEALSLFSSEAISQMNDEKKEPHAKEEGLHEDNEETVLDKPNEKPTDETIVEIPSEKRKKPFWLIAASAVLIVGAVVAIVFFSNNSTSRHENSEAELTEELSSDINPKYAHLLPSKELTDSLSYLMGVVNFGDNVEAECIKRIISNPLYLNTLKQYYSDKSLVAPSIDESIFDSSIPHSVKDYEKASKEIGAYMGASLRGWNPIPISFNRMVKGINDYVAFIDSGLYKEVMSNGDYSLPEINNYFEINPFLNISYEVYMKCEDCLQEYQKAVNLDLQKSFLDSIANTPGVFVTKSGLAYRIVSPGNYKKPGADDTVLVDYVGTFIDGNSFDQGDSISFVLKHTIEGFSEGLQLIGEGGEIILYIPSDLGYGEIGHYPILPNSLLIFDIKLHEVQKKEEPDSNEHSVAA